MKHYDEWISQRNLHEQYESGWLAELAYREALEWVRKSDRVWMEDLHADIEKELQDED